MSGLFKSPLRAAARFPRDRDRDREKKKQRPSCFSPVCARARTCKRKQIPGTFRSTGASHVRERARQPQRFANCRLRPREISSASAILISGRRYRRARLLLPPPPPFPTHGHCIADLIVGSFGNALSDSRLWFSPVPRVILLLTQAALTFYDARTREKKLET